MIRCTRSSWLWLLVVLSTASARSSFAGEAEKSKSDRPNILFIFAGDQSYKTLSCYPGAPDWVKTPHIDGATSLSLLSLALNYRFLPI